MAKLFYTAEEAAAKLGKSVQELLDMAKSGQLQEFKDRDRSLFKVEAVDQLADSGFDMDLDLKLSDGSTAADVDLGLLEDSSQVASSESGELDLSDLAPSASESGELDLGELAPSASSSGELDLGLDLGDDLALADDDAPAASRRASAAPPAGDDAIALAADDDLLGLADSSAGSVSGSAAAPPPIDPAAFDLDLGLGASGSHMPMGLAESGAAPSPQPVSSDADGLGDLGLDLGLDDQGPQAGGSGAGAFGLADTGSMAGAGGSAAPAASGAGIASGALGGSGSMAPAGSRPGKGLLDDSLAGSSMVGTGRRDGSGAGNLETVGSGSGLLDLTKESDESTIGAALLDEVVEGEDGDMGAVGASGIFADAGVTEMTGGEEVFEAPAAAVGGGLSLAAAAITLPEAVDGGGSGLTVGLMVGAMASLVVASLVLVPMTLGAGSQLAGTIASDIWMWVGALAGGTVFCGVVGFFIGRQLE